MLSTIRQPCDEAVVRSQPDTAGCPKAIERWVLAAAILGSSITFIDGTVVNVVLPVLQTELGASVAETQWIVESYALTLAALILVGGSLGDRLGRRRVFSAGVAIFGIASIACGLATSVAQLIVARGIQGIGAALLVPGSLALISANFDKSRRGRAIGTWSGFSAISAGIGPVLGGWLIEQLSWRWIFFINVPLCLAVLAIAWRVPESRDEQATPGLDWYGAVLAAVGLGGIVFGLIESNERGWTDPLVVGSFVLGAAALIAFFVAEARQAEPMMPLGLFRSATFAGTNLLTLFLYAALGGLLFFLPFALIQLHGYTPTEAGAALVPFVLTMFLLSRWAGGLVERHGSERPLIIGPLIAGVGFALFALPGTETSSYWTSFFPAVTVMSIGMTMSVAPLTTTVMSAVPERRSGVASGVNNAVSRIAALLAVAAFGIIMLNVFSKDLARRLHAVPLAAEVRADLIDQSGALLNVRIPGELSDATQAQVRAAIRESFIAGFRSVAYVAAALAAVSALVSWLMIADKADDSGTTRRTTWMRKNRFS